MYHPKIVQRRLEALIPGLGFEPQPHSIAYIRRSIDHLQMLVDPDTGGLTRKLKDDELRFIQNEQILCLCDFRYLATHYAFIKHWEHGGLVLFDPNVAQCIAFDLWGQLEVLGRSVSVRELKARQLGMSTLAEIALAHRAMFYANAWTVVGSSDPDKSTKMVQMMERVWENLPWWLKPTMTRYKVGELIEFGKLKSGVTIAHGSQMSGIARGDTIQAFHLSELADFHNPEELVDASLLKATHESMWLLRILESTAKGRHNWWHKGWEYDKEFYWKGMSRFCPMFLPWFVGVDLYPTVSWLATRPIPPSWHPATLTIKHAERAEAYVRATPLLRDHLGSSWRMSKAQMWFWEVERQEAQFKGTLANFYSEMPADDHEAFQSFAHSAFPIEVISERRENARQPIGIFGVIGAQAEIPLKFHPDRREIDANLPPIDIVANWSPTQQKHRYQLVPLRRDAIRTAEDYEGKLLVWEFPEDGEQYGVGGDLAEGIQQDRSVMEALRKGTYYRNDAQVAEFASKYHGAFDMWPYMMALLTWYSTRNREGQIKQAKAVIECAANGETTQLELKKRGWRHLHQWVRYDNKKINLAKATKDGWFTNGWSRPMMLDYMVKALRDGWIDIHSPAFIDEMADFEFDEKKQRLQAHIGSHDDRLFALGIVFFSMHIMDLHGRQVDPRYDRMGWQESAGVAPIWTPGLQAVDSPMDGSGVYDPLGELLPQAEEIDPYETYLNSMYGIN